MKNIRHEIAIWCQAGVFIILWALLILITEPELKITFGALKEVPHVAVLYMLLHLAFTRWAWHWSIFQGWLVPIPYLQGTWKGNLISTWVNPETGRPVPPIAAVLVVRHSFEHVSCTLLTAESESNSLAASMKVDEESGQRELSYNYTNVPRVTVRHRSDRHAGAAILKLAMTPTLKLAGEYWTSRKTTGEMNFEFVTRRCVNTFDEPLP